MKSLYERYLKAFSHELTRVSLTEQTKTLLPNLANEIQLTINWRKHDAIPAN